MKSFYFASTVFLFVSLTIGITATKANANNYIGEHCWNVSTTHGVIGVTRLGISHLGDGHYICSGTTSVSSPIVKTLLVSGSLAFVGDEIVITLNFAGIKNNTVGPEVINMTLDPESLGGTLKGTGVYFDEVEIFEGTADYTTCQ